jgi:hypothetical protein
MGLAHLSQFAVQPLILLIFLLTPVLIWGDMFRRLPNLSIFGSVGAIPVLIMLTGQIALYADWPRRLLVLPLQGLIGAAMVLNNTLGVLAALHRPGVRREFRRTPKFSAAPWSVSRYALRIDGVTLGEIALGIYALVGADLALHRLPALLPYFLSYAASFILFAAWNIRQTARLRHRSTRRQRARRAAPQRL